VLVRVDRQQTFGRRLHGLEARVTSARGTSIHYARKKREPSWNTAKLATYARAFM
jgi:hypothetical protein